MIKKLLLLNFAFFLSSFLFGQDFNASEVAKSFITSQSGSFDKLQVNDKDLHVKNIVYDKQSKLTHVYLYQRHLGIDIFNAISSVHIKPDGSVFYHNNRFISLKNVVVKNNEVISKESAILKSAEEFGMNIGRSVIQSSSPTLNKASVYENQELSITPIDVNLLYVYKNGRLVLSWDVQFTKRDDHFMWNVKVDTESGEVVSKTTYTLACNWGDGHDHSIHETADQLEKADKSLGSFGADSSYQVWPLPFESPEHGPRTEMIRPWLKALNASPFGWHDTNGIPGAEFTDTRGNNVDAYLDRDGNSVPGFRPDGGANLDFDFPVDLVTESPVDYQDVAAVNLYFMNNIIHDVMYQYGFDEEAGNFQENNYGNGGAGTDPVNAEAQSGADIGNANNAFFGTPPDGSRPTMMMFEFTSTNPRRDSDLDNGIIQHEYGHGISNRLTGGPGSTGCLSNAEQMGEGWSDYITLIMGMKSEHISTTSRGVGTYALGQPNDGPGIRPFVYTTDMTVNTHTYADIVGASTHTRGSVWAEMLWEMTWALIDKHGFNPDIYANDMTGNCMAFQLVTEGMRLQPCSPGFVDGRDAILAADQALYGGDNQCLIWTAFAKRGLGASADQGSTTNSGDGVEAFDLPLSCLDTLILTKTAEVSVMAGQTINYSITASNFYNTPLTNVVLTDVLAPTLTYVTGSATCGGVFSGNTLTITKATMAPDEVMTCTFQAVTDVETSSTTFFSDDLESGTANWVLQNGQGVNVWSLSQANPSSPINSWFTPNSVNEDNTQYVISTPITLQAGSEASVTHDYNTESGWDGGIMEISTNGGTTWDDLGPMMIENGYNGSLGVNDNIDIAGRDAFTGNSNGYVTTRIDLSSFGSQTIQLRFLFGQDDNTFGQAPDPGWYVDDVNIIVPFVIENVVNATSNEGDNLMASATTLILECEVDCFTCDDGIQNGDEEGIDCGGSCPTTCFTCDDGIQNGDEAGVDCGGSFCPNLCPCTTGVSDLNYMDVTLPNPTEEHVTGTINANGNVTIGAGTDVMWRAGTSVNVTGEFTNTGELLIDIEPCELATGGKKSNEVEKSKEDKK